MGMTKESIPLSAKPRASVRKVPRGRKLEKSKAKRLAPDDSAERWRSVPRSMVQERKDDILIPSFYLRSATGSDGDLLRMIHRLELRVSELEATISASADRPMHQPQAEQAKPSSAASVSQIKPQPKATPPSVPGNEAEVLLLPAPPEKPQVDNVVPIAASKTAANDEVIAPVYTPLVRETDSDIAEADESLVQHWIDQFNWSPMEQHNVLLKEFLRRDRQCRRKHKISYDELRLRRALMKDGMEVRGSSVYFQTSPENRGKFRVWSFNLPHIPKWRSFTRDLMLRGDSHKAYMRGMATTPAAYRKRSARELARFKDDTLKPRIQGVKFKNELNYAMSQAAALTVAERGQRTSRAQLRAWGLKIRDGWDSTLRSLGRKTTPLRSAAVRAKYEVADLMSHDTKRKTTERKPSGRTMLPEDITSMPQAELVRRCQRAGIGY